MNYFFTFNDSISKEGKETKILNELFIYEFYQYVGNLNQKGFQ